MYTQQVLEYIRLYIIIAVVYCYLKEQKVEKKKFNTLHKKQNFRKSSQRKYHIFLIFRNCRKYRIFRKTKIQENIIFSIIFNIFRNKSIEYDNDKKMIK